MQLTREFGAVSRPLVAPGAWHSAPACSGGHKAGEVVLLRPCPGQQEGPHLTPQQPLSRQKVVSLGAQLGNKRWHVASVLCQLGLCCENPGSVTDLGTGSPPLLCLSSGVFEVAEASGVRTGTKIIIHLKSDCREFASEARVRGEQEPGLLGMWVAAQSAGHLLLACFRRSCQGGSVGGTRAELAARGVSGCGCLGPLRTDSR